MLSESQIKRVLKHCEKINAENEVEINNLAGNEYFEYVKNLGWCQALRLALEINGPGQINKEPLEEDE